MNPFREEENDEEAPTVPDQRRQTFGQEIIDLL
jgi:hypothetical protein